MHLTAEGFLHDPEEKSFWNINHHLIPPELLIDTKCLILLGEPGIGKSTVIKEMHGHALRASSGNRARVEFIDLAEYGSEDRLVRDVFESEAATECKGGGRTLYLFLDSFDECLIQVKALAQIVAGKLSQFKPNRLYLRVGCRTANWPAFIEERLTGVWSKEDVKVVELACLRRKDIADAAAMEGLSTEEFIENLVDKGLQPLALRPITLGFLIKDSKAGGELQGDKVSLYERGCRSLCEEHNLPRRKKEAAGRLSVRERFAVASRIAAVTSFCNRNAIWLGLTEDCPENALPSSELAHGIEHSDDTDVRVDERAVEDVLDTALFVGRGASLMCFAHQTLQEYLAARYLKSCGVPIRQIASLIKHPGDQTGRLIPQLQGTAGWIARMLPDVCKEIAASDLVTIVREDAVELSDIQRQELVAVYLRQVDAGKAPADLHDRDGKYRYLVHPQLATQLLPYIRDANRNADVRQLAITIAVSCEQETTYDSILEVAQDKNAEYQLRISATWSMSQRGNQLTRAKLKVLVNTTPEEDPDDEIRGCALDACWPEFMSTEELLRALTPPRRDRLYGVYRDFLHRGLWKQAKEEHLPALFRWAGSWQPEDELNVYSGSVIEGLTERAWQLLDHPSVLNAFVDLIFARANLNDFFLHSFLSRHGDEFLEANEDKRYVLAQAMIEKLTDLDEGVSIFQHYYTGLLSYKDLPWLIRQLGESDSDRIRKAAAKLIGRLPRTADTAYLDMIIDACQKYPMLQTECGPLKVDLSSAEADHMRKRHIEYREMTEIHRSKRVPLSPPPAQRVEQSLKAIESGDVYAWVDLWSSLSLKPDDTGMYTRIGVNVFGLPGWLDADNPTRERITKCAITYLMQADPRGDEWVGTSNMPWVAMSGCSAFHLLITRAPDCQPLMTDQVWNTWAVTLLALGWWFRDEDEETLKTLLKIGSDRAAAAFVEAYEFLIDRENVSSEFISALRFVDYCWSGDLASALLAKAREPRLKPTIVKEILVTLFEHQDVGARQYAESLLAGRGSDIQREYSLAVFSAQSLILHTREPVWSVVWPAIQDNPKFGCDVISGVASRYEDRGAQLLRVLDEGQLGELYRWLLKQFPIEEDSDPFESSAVTPREDVARFRGTVLEVLKRKGTTAGVRVLEQIAAAFPQHSYLKHWVFEASDIALEQTASFLRPREFLELVADRNRRLIRSGSELLDLLVDSLQELANDLHGELTQVENLWGWDGSGNNRTQFEPKDELHFAKNLTHHLRQRIGNRAIAVNREVEIRRGLPGAPGQRTDIYVNAFVKGKGQDHLLMETAVIEVKCCWHEEVMTAMKEQLADRYMTDSAYQQGLYVVGWFYCDLWESPKGILKGKRIEDVREQLVEQASGLSAGGRTVKSLVLDCRLVKC